MTTVAVIFLKSIVLTYFVMRYVITNLYLLPLIVRINYPNRSIETNAGVYVPRKHSCRSNVFVVQPYNAHWFCNNVLFSSSSMETKADTKFSGWYNTTYVPLGVVETW